MKFSKQLLILLSGASACFTPIKGYEKNIQMLPLQSTGKDIYSQKDVLTVIEKHPDSARYVFHEGCIRLVTLNKDTLHRFGVQSHSHIDRTYLPYVFFDKTLRNLVAQKLAIGPHAEVYTAGCSRELYNQFIKKLWSLTPEIAKSEENFTQAKERSPIILHGISRDELNEDVIQYGRLQAFPAQRSKEIPFQDRQRLADWLSSAGKPTIYTDNTPPS